MEGEWLCYSDGQFKWRENGHVTRWMSLMEGEWSCYWRVRMVLRRCFNGGRIVMLWRWLV